MNVLKDMQCGPCRGDEAPLDDYEIGELSQQLPGWMVTEHNGVKKLERRFRFKNFAEALAFTNAVGALAEEAGHHPALLTEWGSVTVWWWTHKIKGLHRNDFIMAARTTSVGPGAPG